MFYEGRCQGSGSKDQQGGEEVWTVQGIQQDPLELRIWGQGWSPRMPQGVPVHLLCSGHRGCGDRMATTASVHASHLHYQLPAEAYQWLRTVSTTVTVAVLLHTVGILTLIHHVVIGQFNNILFGKTELS